MLKKIFVFTLLLSLIHFPKVSAVNCDIEVGPNKQYKTIQSGINAATQDQTVCVYYYTYNEVVTIDKKGLTVTGITQNNKKPVIDGRDVLPDKPLDPESIADIPGVGKSVGFNWSAMVEIDAENVTLENLEVANSRGRGILVKVGGHNTKIIDTEVHDTRNQIFVAFGSKGITIDSCLFYRANMYAPFPRTGKQLNWPPSISLKQGSVGAIIKNTTLHDAWGEGIGLAKSSGATIEGNIIYNIWRMGIYLNTSPETTVRNNIIYHTGIITGTEIETSPGIVINNEDNVDSYTPSENILIENNISVGNVSGLTFWGGQEGSTTYKNIKVINNTFHTSTGKPLLAINSNPNYINILFENNIFYNPNSDLTNNFNKNGIKFNNNLWWDGNSGKPSTSFTSLTDIYKNPLFFMNVDVSMIKEGDIEGNYFQLKENSPAIGKASGISPQEDFFGCLRDDKPDIGAIEYGATNCSNNPVPTPTVNSPTPTTTVPANKYDVTGNGVVDILDIIDVIKYLFN